MEDVSGFVLIAYIVGAILSIILFFKIWAMTDNIAEIKAILKKMADNQQKDKENGDTMPQQGIVKDKGVIGTIRKHV